MIKNPLTKYSHVKKFFARDRYINILTVFLLIISLSFLAILAINSMGGAALADDYVFYNLFNKKGFVDSILDYNVYSGRYSNALVLIFSIKLFGLFAIKIVPFLSLLVIVCCAGYVGHWLAKRVIRGTNALARKRLFTALAIFTSLMVLVCAPSLFDTYIWFSAATVYVTGGAAFLLMLAIGCSLVDRPRIHWWQYVALFVSGLFTAGFYEFMPILVGAAGFSVLVISFLKNKRIKKWRRNLLGVSITTMLSAIAGLLLLVTSPWVRMRQAGQNAGFSDRFVPRIVDHFDIISQYTVGWRVLFPVLVGLLLFIIFSKPKSLRRYIWIFALSTVSIFVPILTVGVLVSWANSIDFTGLGSNRVLFAGTSFIMLGIAGLVYLLASSVSQWVKKFNFTPSMFVISMIVALLGFGCSMIYLSRVTQATYLRKSLVSYREALIKHDIASGRESVRVMPATVQLNDSQVIDIQFGGIDQVWVNQVRIFYKIPKDRDVEFPKNPPPVYCTSFASRQILQVQNCAENVQSSPSYNLDTGE